MGEVVPHWLDKQASLNPEKTAIEFQDGVRLSFYELQRAAQAYAKRMNVAGIRSGDHIGLLAGSSLDFIIALHGLSYLGAVAVLLNIRLAESELAYQLDDADVSFLLADAALSVKGEKSIELANHDIRFSIFSGLPSGDQAELLFKKEINLDDLATIIYTSGTTGLPKGVCHTYGNHWWSAVSSALNLGLSPDDKWLASLPFFHVSGLSILMKSLIYGMPIYVIEKFDPSVVKKCILKDKVTLVSLVSVLLDQLLTEMKFDTFPLNFRGVLLGGGPAPASLLKKAAFQTIAVFQSYGLTETSSQIATLSPSDAMKKLGSAGKPLFPAQLKIMNEQREDNNGTAGEIWVKGPMVSPGYYRNDEANAKAFRDGWLATGDLGYLDQEGFLYILDRRKDLIISGGENIYPAEIEGVLSGMEGVLEAGVIGKPDEKWGQVPVAFVVTKNAIDSHLINEYCRKRLAHYKVPKEIFFIERLPRNASHKVVRQQLTKLLEDKLE